jgi:hypothetical protein
MMRIAVLLGIVALSGGCTFNITFNITGNVPARPESGSPKLEEDGLLVYPPELRAGDIFTDERGDEWALMSRATRSVGTLDFVATVQRVEGQADSPAETREARWRANERVKIRRPLKDREPPPNP